MWPILTLTLLLQLTSDEQLYAQQMGPAIQPQVKEQVAPTPAVAPDELAVDWKEVGDINC